MPIFLKKNRRKRRLQKKACISQRLPSSIIFIRIFIRPLSAVKTALSWGRGGAHDVFAQAFAENSGPYVPSGFRAKNALQQEGGFGFVQTGPLCVCRAALWLMRPIRASIRLLPHTLEPSRNALFSESALSAFPLPQGALASGGFFCAPRREGELFSLWRPAP